VPHDGRERQRAASALPLETEPDQAEPGGEEADRDRGDTERAQTTRVTFRTFITFAEH
jgi:hypothetical protein